MNGTVQLWHDGTIPGPYKKEAREHWLRRVLEAQQSVRREGPEEFRDLQLISLEELDEIRRIWLHEKHEFDDSLPRIYEEVTGEAVPEAAATRAIRSGPTTGSCSARSARATRCSSTSRSPCSASSRSSAA